MTPVPRRSIRCFRCDLLLAVLCLLLPALPVDDALCSPADAGAPPREVGGSAVPPAEPERAPDPAPPRGFETEVEFGPGVQSLSSEDLDRTYGLLPSFGVAVSWRLLAETRLVLGARYACSTGDPYYDLPDFHNSDGATLRAVPVSFGVRANLNPRSRLRYHLGCAFQVAWIQETLPVDGAPAHYTGLGRGPLATSGPEWRSRDGRRAVGLEFAWGGRGWHVDHGTDRHDVDLTGVHARVYYVFRPGAAAPREEGSR